MVQPQPPGLASLQSIQGYQIGYRCLELSITNGGRCPTKPFKELKAGNERDSLAPSNLDHSPGLELSICQLLLKPIGRESNFALLKDDRTRSRLLLPRISSDH